MEPPVAFVVAAPRGGEAARGGAAADGEAAAGEALLDDAAGEGGFSPLALLPLGAATRSANERSLPLGL